MNNIYPDEMRDIIKIIEALNAVGAGTSRVMLKSGIPVIDEGGTIIGYLLDEIGDAWSFTTDKPEC